MVLSTDTRDFVAAKGGPRRGQVIAICPYAPRWDAAPHPVRQVTVSRPHASAQPVESVVRQFERFGFVLKCRHRQHWSKDLLLEDSHLVVTLEYGRLEVIAALEPSTHVRRFSTNEYLRTLLFADLDVGLDFVQLLARDLWSNHRLRVQGIALG